MLANIKSRDKMMPHEYFGLPFSVRPWKLGQKICFFSRTLPGSACEMLIGPCEGATFIRDCRGNPLDNGVVKAALTSGGVDQWQRGGLFLKCYFRPNQMSVTNYPVALGFGRCLLFNSAMSYVSKECYV